MNIIFDIAHPAHLNFLKHAIYYLDRSGKHKVYVTCLRRGNLPIIAKKELDGIDLTFVGKHRGTFLSIIFEANIRKFIELLYLSIKNNVQFGVALGSIPLGGALKLLGKKNIQFIDDTERKKHVFLLKIFSTKTFTPPITGETNVFKNFNASKEWAYLSPKYFKPKMDILDQLNLKAKDYIFVREVSTGSLNYTSQDAGLILNIANDFPKSLRVVLSLEEKSLAEHYPKDWIILEEPVSDIHSLIFYSFALVSSGDSMAREGAQLGVPSIYCGFRDMKANKILANLGMVFEMEPDQVGVFLERLVQNDMDIEDQDSFRNRLENEWDDLTQLIISQVENYE